MKDWFKNFGFTVVMASITAIVVWALLLFIILLIGRAYESDDVSVLSQSVVCNEMHNVNVLAIAQKQIKEDCAIGGITFTDFDRPIIAEANDYDFAIIYATKENTFPLRIAEYAFKNGRFSRSRLFVIKKSDGYNGINREMYLKDIDANEAFFKLTF